jgi:hypothetical protein
MKLTTHLHLVPRSKNAWSCIPTPQYASCRGAHLKHRDNFTFTLPYREGDILSGGQGRDGKTETERIIDFLYYYYYYYY